MKDVNRCKQDHANMLYIFVLADRECCMVWYMVYVKTGYRNQFQRLVGLKNFTL